MEHQPPAIPEQPQPAAPPPPGEMAHALQTLQSVMRTIAPARSMIADSCVLWQTGALLSTSREMLGARGDFLNTRTTLKGKRGRRRISRAGLRAYAEGCPQLSSVDLSGCNHITDEYVIALSQGCPQLSYLNLYNCNQITDASVIRLQS